MKQLYGVIGNPIEHSMSPLIHNDAFVYLGINAYYHAFRIKEKDLGDAVKGFKAIGISGFNVTTPHKVEIMQYLDEVDELAKEIGAVNTVVSRDGKLIGYNTDGIGYVRSLQSISKGPLKEKNILVLGAGGAARAIFVTLASMGVKRVDIANRTKERAKELIRFYNDEVNANAFSIQEAEAVQNLYDVIIHTTTVGMHPNTEESPFSLGHLKEDCIVSDIIYNPLETKLLRVGRQQGAITQNGVDMFVYQGALAFELWTGILPNIERMKKLVTTKLGG
ncbi:shikimate dehydrogenase [Bacillus sp. 165]|uniref:shikimate dehydrogenase n=1 Tax=Bacillus sp. 165 TaxID=1529117 RepID=UPI001ADAB94D|nr:shikimate dehydrogenase [Bacillus sp. 165]MBO9129568.1 shikimate dehydrogenase [Bacillus sp. 165]